MALIFPTTKLASLISVFLVIYSNYHDTCLTDSLDALSTVALNAILIQFLNDNFQGFMKSIDHRPTTNQPAIDY